MTGRGRGRGRGSFGNKTFINTNTNNPNTNTNANPSISSGYSTINNHGSHNFRRRNNNSTSNEPTIDYSIVDANAGMRLSTSSFNNPLSKSLAIINPAGRFAPLTLDSESPDDVPHNQRNRSRQNPYGMGSRSQPFRNSNLRNGSASSLTNEVSILNWKDRNSDPISFFEFVKNQITTTTIDIINHAFDGDAIIIKLKNPQQINAVRGLSGVKYNGGRPLIVKLVNPITPSTAKDSASETAAITQQPDVIALISDILRSRYNEDHKFVNLESLPDDPAMQSNSSLSGFGTDVQDTAKIAPVICKLVGQLFPNVLSINFTGNKLSNLKPFETLSVYCPLVQNLSFENNMIQTYKDLEGLRGDKLKNLREIVFSRNPVHDREAKKGEAALTGYRTKIKAIFPSIQLLDMIPFEAEVALPEIGLPSADDLPETEKGAFMDTDVTANLVQQFVPKFLALFDSNRPALSEIYTENSQFSVSVNPSVRNAGNGKQKASQNKYSIGQFDTWLANNRNHVSCKDSSKRLSMMAKGVKSISELFARLPQTKHPINLSFDKQLLVADAFQQQMQDGSVVILLTIQGQFEEVQLNKNKAFTRTFVLIPAPPGSSAAQAGWDLAILNDMLVIRLSIHGRSWANKPSSQMSAQPTNGPLLGLAHGSKPFEVNSSGIVHNGRIIAAVGALPSDMGTLAQLKNAFQLDDAKHSLVLQLAQTTGLNYQFAAQCLNEVGWNGEAAMSAFNSVRGQIPPAAFVFQPI
ncbi:nuclear mRNA export, poly(A)+RNA binding protein [Physocladia obscura]|uniref:Nuclear mRNA export, poly(A)+RNA binding protein n=1 Tax=Physocladia obscura TaxID=109957 RepID=A0AAD5T7F6_9FUNG|nr:nuclear mRNA export, poly(A)+RNA binding protein [Physocladia obscura]